MATPPNTMTAFTEPMMVHATDLNPFTQNINDLYTNQLGNGYFSRYTMSNNVASTTWTVAVPNLAEGTGLGLSLFSNLFTLTAGIWEVTWNLQLIAGAATNLILQLSSDTTTTAANPIINGTFVGTSGVTAGSISTHIRSTGTAVVAAKCFIPTATGAGTSVLSRLTFVREMFS